MELGAASSQPVLPAAVETFSAQQLAVHAHRIAKERPEAGGVHGVRWDPQNQKWQARILYEGEEITLCYFAALADAIERRLLAEKAVAEGRHPTPSLVADALLPAAVEPFSDRQLAEHARRIAEERPTAEGVIGVSWHKMTRKWIAQINYKAKQIHLGIFITLADAIKCRLLAEKAVAEGKHPKPSLVAEPLPPVAVEPFSDRQLAERARRIAEDMPAAEGVNGVSWHKATRKWVAKISYKAKQINLGHFAALPDAIECRLLAEKAKAEGKHPKPPKVDKPLLPAAVETFSAQQLAEHARRIAVERPTAEGIIGVCWHMAMQKWEAKISYKAKSINLGRFASLADAIERRLLAEKAKAEGKHPKPPEVGKPLLPAVVETFSAQQLAEHARRIAVERPTAEGIIGVYWDKSMQKWEAQSSFQGKSINLGRFASLADAIERRLLAEKAKAEGKHPRPHSVLPASVETFSAQQLAVHAHRIAKERPEAGGVHGVRWDPQNQKWQARILYEGEEITLCYFAALADAIERRLLAEKAVAEGRHPKTLEAILPTTMTEEESRGRGQRVKRSTEKASASLAQAQSARSADQQRLSLELLGKEALHARYEEAVGRAVEAGFSRDFIISKILQMELQAQAAATARGEAENTVTLSPVAAYGNASLLPAAVETLSRQELAEHARRIAKERPTAKGVRGVAVNSRGEKWHVQINVKGKHFHLGDFADLANAIERRLLAEKAKAEGRHPKSPKAVSLLPAPVETFTEQQLAEHALRIAEERPEAEGVQGVCWINRDQRWQAVINKAKVIYLGRFTALAPAIESRLLAEKALAEGRDPKQPQQQAHTTAATPVVQTTIDMGSLLRARSRAKRIAKDNPTAKGFAGVSQSKDSKKWLAQISFQCKTIHLGTFTSVAEAIERRLLAEEAVAEGRHPKPPQTGGISLPAAIETLSARQLAEHARRIAKGRQTSKGIKGVFWDSQKGKWRVVIFFEGKKHTLGGFSALADAIERRLLAEKSVAEGKDPKAHYGGNHSNDSGMANAPSAVPSSRNKRGRATDANTGPSETAPAGIKRARAGAQQPVASATASLPSPPQPPLEPSGDYPLAERARRLAREDPKARGVTGVTWAKTRSIWKVDITFARRTMHLGYFQDLADAIECRLRAEKAMAEGRHPRLAVGNRAIGRESTSTAVITTRATHAEPVITSDTDLASALPGVALGLSDAGAACFEASIGFEGRSVDLGRYADWGEAVLARLRAETDAACGRRPGKTPADLL